MQSLAELAYASRTDKGTIHSYIDVYEELFRPYRETAKAVLEIGVLGGESIRLWNSYFTTKEIHGVDVSMTPLDTYDLAPMIAEGFHIHIADATRRDSIDRVLGDMTFDIVIDDASHALEHQLLIYKNLKHRLSKNGLYVIEDIADIDSMRGVFENIDPSMSVEILDRRHLKDRFDDVLVIIREPV